MIESFIKSKAVEWLRGFLKIPADRASEIVGAFFGWIWPRIKPKRLEGEELHKAQLETMERRTPGLHE